MSQLVFIILINLIVLLTVGLGLSLFFALRQRKNRQQAIDKMLTGITKQQSGRTEDLQTKLGTPEQTGTDHSASIRELAMAENAFYQQLLVALLDTSGSKLTKVPDTVQTLLDQYLSTLTDQPTEDKSTSAQGEPTEPETIQAEDDISSFDDPDDIEVALDLSELDEPESPEPKADEPAADTMDDDVLLGGEEADDSEPEPAEPESPEPQSDDSPADTMGDDVLLGGEEADDSEPEPTEPETDETPTNTPDDDVMLGADDPDDSEPAPAQPETPDVPPDDPNDIKDTLNLDNLDELDELDTTNPEPIDTAQDEPDRAEPKTDETPTNTSDDDVMLGADDPDDSEPGHDELGESEPQDQAHLASLQDDLDTSEPASDQHKAEDLNPSDADPDDSDPSTANATGVPHSDDKPEVTTPLKSDPDEAPSSTEEKPAFSPEPEESDTPESDNSKAIADEDDSLLGADAAPEPSVSEAETIEPEPDFAEGRETAPELETDVRLEESLKNPVTSEPDSTPAKPDDDETPAESVPEPSLTPHATTDTETQAKTPEHISASSAEASLIDEPSEPVVPPEDEAPEKTAAELPPATAEKTKPDTPEAVTQPSDDRSQRTIAPDFAARDDDDLEFDLDLDALLEEDNTNDDINRDKAASSGTPAAQASTAEDDIETVMDQAREKTPPPTAKSPSDEPDPDKS